MTCAGFFEFKMVASAFTHGGMQLGSASTPFAMDDGEVFAWYTNVMVNGRAYKWARMNLNCGTLHCWVSAINTDVSTCFCADAVY
jgi:hypothetical protein